MHKNFIIIDDPVLPIMSVAEHDLQYIKMRKALIEIIHKDFHIPIAFLVDKYLEDENESL